MPKRDFIFTDEASDPAEATPYYIQGLLHITDESLKKINVDLGAFRYFGHIRGEIKSTKLNKLQREKLLSILENRGQLYFSQAEEQGIKKIKKKYRS